MFDLYFVYFFVGALFFFAFKSIMIVPQQEVWIIERLGKYSKSLEAGLTFIIPFIDNVAYKHTLKELPIDVKAQAVITQDNVTLIIDGIVYVKVVDPKSASYGVSDPIFAIIQLAQTTMRSEIGKIPMDKTFEERESLNVAIVNTLNNAAISWGIQCMRYEIKDISPPKNVVEAMELQVAAERQKRAEILNSEGKRQSQINIAEADKQKLVLESEGAYQDKINRAKGDAEAIMCVAEATAKGIEKIASAVELKGGHQAVSLKLAEQYISAFSNIAKTSNTLIVPSNASDAASMVSQALSIYDTIKNK